MKSNSKKISKKTVNNDVKELVDESALKAHCAKLDAQGIRYQIIPVLRRQLSA